MDHQAPYDARAVANYFLDLADERNQKLTQVQLLKLLYFAHGWYLSSYGKSLISHDFEAWTYGPVVKVVRDEFKSFGEEPITSRAAKLDIFSGSKSIVEPDLEHHDSIFVRLIFDAYYIYDAWQLSSMTHEEGSPWDVLWNSSEPVGRLALRIRNEDIKKHFDNLPQRFALV